MRYMSLKTRLFTSRFSSFDDSIHRDSALPVLYKISIYKAK